MFEVHQLETGEYVVKNIIGGFVNRDGVIRTFKTPEKAAKHILKINRSLRHSLKTLDREKKLRNELVHEAACNVQF